MQPNRLLAPLTDRAGRFAPFKAAVLAGCCAPALWLIWAASNQALTPAGSLGQLGPRPLTEAIHQTGDWAIRFLWLSLAVTPLRRIANWPKLVAVRRMLGVTALVYALSHLGLYVVDQKFDIARVVSEIALRFYLTIGFAALLALAVLGSTSTDAAIKRLGGRNWNRLHRIVYAIGLFAGFHFFIQSKADVYEPTLMAGLFLLLMLYRAAHWRGYALTAPLVLAAAAGVAAVGTAAVEYAWYALATGIPPERVLAANLQFAHSIRPAWWVLATGIGMTLLALARPLFRKDEPARDRRARAAAA